MTPPRRAQSPTARTQRPAPAVAGGAPSSDEIEMEDDLNEARSKLLEHCDLAAFHAVVATALRLWASVLKSGLRSRAPLRIWRDALLRLAMQYEIPGDALAKIKPPTEDVGRCQALVLMSTGGAYCLSAI